MALFGFKKPKASNNSSVSGKLSGALKDKQIQAEILMQSIADGLIVNDVNGVINLINPSACNITGWPENEAVGIDVRNILKLYEEQSTPNSPLKETENPIFKVISDKKHFSGNYQLISRDNKTRIVSLVVSPVFMPGSEEIVGTVSVLRDISATKEEEQRRADFISTASHEMRTPVAAIEGYLALALNDKVSKIDAKARSYLEKAHASTQHLGVLFQDLLTSAKAEDGRLVNHPRVVEMGEYLEQIVEAMRFSAEKKGLLAEYVIGSSDANKETKKLIKPLYFVHVDPDRVREVITNLFDNAVKYTDKGKVTIGLTGNKDVVQIFIRDTGHGIPKEDVSHLFQKFYRVDNSSTRTVGGTGLGLFICKKIIELYNGRIWVDSELGKGSTFYINLPRLTSEKAQSLKAGETVSGEKR